MRKLIWSKRATKSFLKILDFIEKDSTQNAQKISTEVLKIVNESSRHPEHHRRDKYKVENNNGSFRAFEIHSIRISFFYDANVLRILRVRHTKRKPLNY
ncbi:MAG: type II toxin-antitoxin system RelE/ParE family toxin [Ferruginibacter sp.]|nr:type II toxin-antitoxin system RelE/ParE family toxin [Ferruginibacter sp.]